MGRWLVLAVACGLLAACGSGARPAPPGFLSVDGTSLRLDGEPIVLRGINVYNAASTGQCWYDMRDELPRALDTLRTRAGANVIRVWFFESLATSEGRRDWAAFDRVLATARAHGLKVVPVLTDQWGACEDGRYKDVTWYEQGYRSAYASWVREVVTRYRDDPTVALWSLVNEAEARTQRDGPCPPQAHAALRGFVDEMARTVKDVDPSHLLGVGTIGTGQCGASGDEYADLHASALVDVAEYHDYDPAPMPGDAYNGLAVRLAQCATLDKPLLVGESGIDPARVGGLGARAAAYRAKIAAQREAGIAGLLMWGWDGAGAGPSDVYGIGPDDPSLTELTGL